MMTLMRMYTGVHIHVVFEDAADDEACVLVLMSADQLNAHLELHDAGRLDSGFIVIGQVIQQTFVHSPTRYLRRASIPVQHRDLMSVTKMPHLPRYTGA